MTAPAAPLNLRIGGTDTTAPTVSGISSGTPGVSTATITWTTNEASNSQVMYGLTTAYGSLSSLNSSLVTSHSVTITGLDPASTYHFRVRSRDAAGNLALGSDATFLTANPAGDIVANAGENKEVYFPSNSVSLFGSATSANPLSVAWSKVSGPGTVTFTGSGSLTASATFSAAGSYVLRLTATDGSYTATDDATMTVHAASDATEYYVDPTSTAVPPDGTAAKPWLSLGGSGSAAWNQINSALGTNAVIVYFSVRIAASDTSETSDQIVIWRTDTSSHRLILTGMDKWNQNESSPSWADYSGSKKFKINSTDDFGIGWTLDNKPGKDYITIRGFESTGGSGRITWGASHSVLEYCDVHDITVYGSNIQFHKYVVGPAPCTDKGVNHDITVRGNTVVNGYGEGIYIGGDYTRPDLEPTACMVYEGTDDHNGHYDILVEGNSITDAGANGGQGDGIDIKAGLLNLTIRGNTITGGVNSSAGIVLAETTFSGVDGKHIIEDNVLSGNPSGSVGILIGYNIGTILRNNVLKAGAGVGISVTGNTSYQINSNLKFYNNTIYGHTKGINLDYVDGVILRNNLVFGNSTYQFDKTSSAVNLDSDYNVYAAPTKPGGWTEGANTYTESIPENLVNDAAGGDFTLKTGSNAIGRGQVLNRQIPAGFGTDCIGTVRGATWDVGAYEY